MGISDQNYKESFGEKPEPGKPLEGRTVVVTRPESQSGEITGLLEKLGARVIHCPTIEVVEPASWGAVDSALERLDTYDWIVFTSANGPRFFFRRLLELRRNAIDSVNKATVFAIGPATARSVEAYAVRVDVIATDSRAEGALKAIIEKAGGEQLIRGLRILMPRGRIARETLPAELTRLGAQVDDVEVYRTIKPDIESRHIVTMFEARQVDAITFTSPSTITNFISLVAAENVREFFGNTLIACIGPVTSAAAAEIGLENIIQPQVYNAQALVEAIIKSLRRP